MATLDVVKPANFPNEEFWTLYEDEDFYRGKIGEANAFFFTCPICGGDHFALKSNLRYYSGYRHNGQGYACMICTMPPDESKINHGLRHVHYAIRFVGKTPPPQTPESPHEPQ